MPARKPNGAGLAAILAAALGVFAIGSMTLFAEMSQRIENELTWWDPVGSLSGKTGIGVLAWLISWVVIHSRYKSRDVEIDRLMILVWVLVLLGLLGTFPPFLALFNR